MFSDETPFDGDVGYAGLAMPKNVENTLCRFDRGIRFRELYGLHMGEDSCERRCVRYLNSENHLMGCPDSRRISSGIEEASRPQDEYEEVADSVSEFP